MPLARRTRMRRSSVLLIATAWACLFCSGQAVAQGAQPPAKGEETAPLPPGHPAIDGAPVPAGPLRETEGEDDEEDEAPPPPPRPPRPPTPPPPKPGAPPQNI